MFPFLFIVIPLGSHRLAAPLTAVWVITTLAAGVITPPPPIEPLVNSTTEPEHAPMLSCSLVIHILAVASNTMPHGLLIVGSPPGTTLLFSTVTGVAGVT